jgi:hypothetical protein
MLKNNIIFAFYIRRNHMKTISLKIDDSIFGETEKIVSGLAKSRNRYINEALDYYNRLQKRRLLEKKLKIESSLVQEDSISVLNEFEDLDYGY